MPPARRHHGDAAAALVAVAPLASRWIERLLAAGEPPLTVSQYLALRAIDRDRISGAELARRTGVSGPAVSQLLASLAEAGLIERHAAAPDRRRQEVTLSASGQAVYRAARSLLAARVGALLADVPGPEADALARLLPRVEAALAGTAPPRRPPPPKRPKAPKKRAPVPKTSKVDGRRAGKRHGL